VEDKKGIHLFGKDYKYDDLSDKQKALINHITDIDGKLKQAQFSLEQYSFCRLSFLNELEGNLNENKEEKVDK
jgi:hypothetical protein